MKSRNWGWIMGLIVVLIAGISFCAFGQDVAPTDASVTVGDVVVSDVAVDAVVPNPDQDLGAVLKLVIEAFQGGQWFVLGGLILMLIVWTIGKFLNVSSTWLPIVTAGSGMLLAVVSSLIGGKIWYEALYFGLLTSGQATLFWSIFGKKILPTNNKPKTEKG